MWLLASSYQDYPLTGIFLFCMLEYIICNQHPGLIGHWGAFFSQRALQKYQCSRIDVYAWSDSVRRQASPAVIPRCQDRAGSQSEPPGWPKKKPLVCYD